MDPTPTLQSIAGVFPVLSDQALEDNLVIFDALLNVSEAKYRPDVAEIVRNAADAAQSPERRERLLKAAATIAAGEPCALTPEGLTASQAAAASTVTADQLVDPDPPAPPSFEEDIEHDDNEDEDEDQHDDDQMAEAPPQLPHLPVRHFFSDLAVRVAQDFTDAEGNQLRAGNTFQLLRSDRNEAGVFSLIPRAGPVRSIRLDPDQHAAIIENAGNAWLQPVPSTGCLEELCYWIGRELNEAENALDEDTPDEDSDDYEDRIDRIDDLRGDVQACRDWLEEDPATRDEPPKPQSLPLAAEIFGRSHRATAWLQLLYAGITVTFSA